MKNMVNKRIKDFLEEKNKKNEFDSRCKELGDLEKLSEKFGKNQAGEPKTIDIQGDFVYGYASGKRKYLGSFREYTRYKKLKAKYGSNNNRTKEQESQDRAYKSFLESQRSLRRE